MTNGNEAAFGFVDNRSSSYEDNEVHYGCTKREYFAAMAMQGYIAAGSTGMPGAEQIAAYSIKTADVLIKALNK